MGKHQGMEGIKRIKFQLNISKIMPARPKNPQGHGYEYQYNIKI